MYETGYTVLLCAVCFPLLWFICWKNTEDPPGEVVLRAEMTNESKVGALTRFVEVLATIGSFLLVLVTLPFSLCFTFKVVQEYERAVVFRMGRLKSGAYGPGKRVIRNFSLSVNELASVISSPARREWLNPFIVARRIYTAFIDTVQSNRALNIHSEPA